VRVPSKKLGILGSLLLFGSSVREVAAQQTATPSVAPRADSQAAERSFAAQELPTSKGISDAVPGAPRSINSFPLNIALSPDGRFAVVLNNGYGTAESNFQQSLTVLDLRTNQLTDYPESRLSNDARQSFFLGLAFSSDGKHLFASISSLAEGLTDGTSDKAVSTGNGIAVYAFDSGKITSEKFLKVPYVTLSGTRTAAVVNAKLPAGTLVPYPAGLAIVRQGSEDRLLVAENLSDDAVLLDPASGTILQRFDLSTQAVVPGSYPYAVAVTRDGTHAYVSLWNASRVAELNLAENRVVRMIPLRLPTEPTAAGSHPTALLLSPDESRLYVALANADEVAVADTHSGSVLSYLSTQLPEQIGLGASPVSLAQNASGSRLYVATAGANAVAVFDLKQAEEKGKEEHQQTAAGFIPTQWYPQALAVHNEELLVACGKGRGAGPNQTPVRAGANGKRRFAYIFEILHGSLARISLAKTENDLPSLTKAVIAANFGRKNEQQLPFPGGKSPIRHVIYIIKENRTYDQLFGDLGEGNGDPSLTMFGEEVTPNQHRLAREFGLLDNFYDSGEVSGDGHNWSTAAIASDYLEKTVQIAYRNKYERGYDYEGEVAGRFPLEDDMPDVNEAGTGYIWTNVARHGLTYRHYGEFVATRWCNAAAAAATAASPREGTPPPGGLACQRAEIKKGELLPPPLGQPHGSPSPWPWAVPMIAKNVATKPELRNHFDPRAADFNLDYPDQLRVDEFLNEFAGFTAAEESGKGLILPNYVLLRLGNDHTSGTRPGHASPAAAVADNDLAVGRAVEAVSNSVYWKDTAILVLEDDAQNGPDHVDAHRSIALVISAYSPSSAEAHFRESAFYTTVNMVRTLEALLGLPPMNHNDAQAPVLASLFAGKGNHAPFQADYRNRDNGLLYEMNSPAAPAAAESLEMDFSQADRADSAKLNDILWHDRMGERPMPAPQHTVFPESPEAEGLPTRQ
jgi:DNA-binding beta-propeller fold protein YncE